MVADDNRSIGNTGVQSERKLRVLFVVDHLGVGGVQEFILNYTRCMTHKVTVAALFKNNFYVERLRLAGAEVITISDRPYTHIEAINPRNFLAFRRFISSEVDKFDVVQIRLFISFLYMSLLRLYRRQNVYASVDATPMQMPFYIRILYHTFARHYKWFLMPLMYVDEFRFIRVRESRRVSRQYFVTPNSDLLMCSFVSKYNFLSVGRCIDQKGHQDAIRFFRALRPYLKGTSSLSIIGTGPTLSKLERLAEADPDIHFLGSVPGIGRYLSGCTAVLKFALGEGENSVIREAALAGKPVITTLETAHCHMLARQGFIFPITRDDASQTQFVADMIARFGPEEAAVVRSKAEQVWGEEAIKAAWAGYPSELRKNHG